MTKGLVEGKYRPHPQAPHSECSSVPLSKEEIKMFYKDKKNGQPHQQSGKYKLKQSAVSCLPDWQKGKGGKEEGGGGKREEKRKGMHHVGKD